MATDQQMRAVVMTTPTERELRFERMFDHPRDRVWAAFTDPALIAQWWGGGTRVEQMDVRVGGTWRFSADRDRTYVFEGEYLEVDPPRRIVQTSHNGWNGLTATETIELEDLGGKTRLVQTSTFATPEDRDNAMNNGAQQGANYQFAHLDQVLNSAQGHK